MTRTRTLKIVGERDEIHALTDNTGDQLLTVQDVARRLACSAATVYALAARGAFPGVVRFPGSRLIRVSARALDRYIASQANGR